MYASLVIFHFESVGGLRVGDAEISYFGIFQIWFCCCLEMPTCFWKVLLPTKKGGWKIWKPNKTVWNYRKKMFQFNRTQDIFGELSFCWFYAFRIPIPYPALMAEAEGHEMQPVHKSCRSHSSPCMEHLVLISQVFSGMFFCNKRDCMHWVSWRRVTSEAFLPQVILLGK